MSDPLIVHGGDESYYTGKIEAYLRAKGIPYRNEKFSRPNLERCAAVTGVMQIPQIECSDGSFLIDTTLIIEHLENTHTEPRLSSPDPAIAFVSRLIEDYGDEWLWRPAMHYRWSYFDSAHLMRHWLAQHLGDQPGPMWLKKQWWYWRQWGFFVRGDGVTNATRNATEASYLKTLEKLEAIFQKRNYVMGERPMEADFGLFASMFRHFFCDPTPGRIMREKAPAVHEWVARLWNASPERSREGALPGRLEPDLAPLLGDICSIYIPYLDANATAYAQNAKKVEYSVQGVSWKEPMKPYRVYCRDRLQLEYCALSDDERERVEALLPDPHALDSLLTPSPKRATDVVGTLPIKPGTDRTPKDSWWRQ